MNTWILTNAAYPRGGSYRYKIPGSVERTAALVEEYRESGRLLPVEGYEATFYVNPEHVVAIYVAKEGE